MGDVYCQIHGTWYVYLHSVHLYVELVGKKSRRPMDPSWDMEKIEPGKSMDRTLDVSWIRSAERAWLKKISLSQWQTFKFWKITNI